MKAISAAIERLQTFIFPIVPQSAIEYLKSVLQDQKLECLYLELFPAEYAASTASRLRFQDGKETDFSPKEIEFFKLIHTQCFPLTGMQECMRLEEYVEIDYLRDCILPDVRGWCDWREEGDITYYPHTIQALMYLADSCLEEYLEYAENDAAYEFVQKYAKVIGVENISFKQLERLCSQKPAPLCYLPATLRHAYGASDNIFLDCWNAYHIVSDELEWTIANIKIWTEEWQAAKPIYDGIDTLVNYLKEDNERFHEIFKLWNQCRKR